LCSRGHRTAQEHFTQALELQGLLDLHGALECLTHAHEAEPGNAEVLTLASKMWTDHTYLPGMQRRDIMRCNERAIFLAKAAQAADSGYSLAHSAECISKGRLASFERNPKRMLELAKEAQEAAYRALECNAEDDIAHHLMGRWHVGMATLNVIVRQCIKYVFGTEFRPGTMEGALKSYRSAVAIRPDRVIHRIELARCLVAFGYKDEALRELKVSTTVIYPFIVNRTPLSISHLMLFTLNLHQN
jgi:tetratricopeptide (TPR) repeat protein